MSVKDKFKEIMCYIKLKDYGRVISILEIFEKAGPTVDDRAFLVINTFSQLNKNKI